MTAILCCVVSRLADYQWFIYGIAAVKWSCEVKSGRVLWIAFLCWCAVKKLLTYSCRCSLSWERQQISTTHSLMQVQPKLRTAANVHYSLTHSCRCSLSWERQQISTTHSWRCSLSWERQQMSTTHSLMQVQPKLRMAANIHWHVLSDVVLDCL